MIGHGEALIDSVADEIGGAVVRGPWAELGGLDGKGDGNDEGLEGFERHIKKGGLRVPWEVLMLPWRKEG
jgi:hypothetical protein